MTDKERTAIAESLFAAIRRLVPLKDRDELTQHLGALSTVFADQAFAYHGVGYQQGRDEERSTITTQGDVRYAQGRRDGMISVECRVDARDPVMEIDPPELSGVQ